jgi:hypothetical protein
MSFISSLFTRVKTEDMICHDKRSERRHQYEIDTELIDSTGKKWDCKIVNMSESGIGISIQASFLRGDLLRIVKPKIMAAVVWSKDNRAGLMPMK